MSIRQWIIGITCLLFIGGGLFYTFLRKSKLDTCIYQSGIELLGTVDEIVHYKGKNVKIYFRVEGKRYLASGKAYDANAPVNIGDRFYIIYCEEDPSMNRILFDKKVPH